MRAPSVRGLLRYWFRASALGAGLSPNEARRDEALVFGSVHGDGDGLVPRASRVVVRFASLDQPRPVSVDILPHKDNRSLVQGLPEGSKFSVSWALRPARPVYQGALDPASCIEWLVPVAFGLGGLGQRSRRGFGTLRAEGSSDLASAIDTLRRGFGGQQQDPTEPQDYPVLSPALAVVLEGRLPPAAQPRRDVPPFRDHPHAAVARSPQDGPPGGGSAETVRRVMAEVFHEVSKVLPRGGGTFGGIRPRRASAFHLRILAGGCLRATIFRLKGEGGADVRKQLQVATDKLGLTTVVWGTKWWEQPGG